MNPWFRFQKRVSKDGRVAYYPRRVKDETMGELYNDFLNDTSAPGFNDGECSIVDNNVIYDCSDGIPLRPTASMAVKKIVDGRVVPYTTKDEEIIDTKIVDEKTPKQKLEDLLSQLVIYQWRKLSDAIATKHDINSSHNISQAYRKVDHCGMPIEEFTDDMFGALYTTDCANLYTSHLLFRKIDGEYRRKKAAVAVRKGIFFDFDAHTSNTDDKIKTLKNIEQILLSPEFQKEIPYSVCVHTGNGYQIHFPYYTFYPEDKIEHKEAVEKDENIIRGIINKFKSMGLQGDESCIECSKGHRVFRGISYNCKAMADENDFNARKKVEILFERDINRQQVYDWIATLTDYMPKPVEPKQVQKNKVDLVNLADEDKQILRDEVKRAIDCFETDNPVAVQFCTNHDNWIKMNFSFCDLAEKIGEEAAFQLLDEWAQKAPNYESEPSRSVFEDCLTKYNDHPNPRRIASIFHEAKNFGYTQSEKYAKWWRKQNGELLPPLLLPSPTVKYIDTAKELGVILNQEDIYYSKGLEKKTFCRMTNTFNGPSLEEISATKLISVSETVVDTGHMGVDKTKGKENKLVEFMPARMTKTQADNIIVADSFLDNFRNVTVIVNAPLLVERDNELKEIVGYDAATHVYAIGEPTTEYPLLEAKAILLRLFEQYSFAPAENISRAVSAFLSPAFTAGRLMGETRSPMIFIEADKSQTGKGLMLKLIWAIYNEVAWVINEKNQRFKGWDDQLDHGLYSGKSFIYFDNIRTLEGTNHLESAMTEPHVSVRVMYTDHVLIDPRNISFFLTTNGTDGAKDMAERVCPISISNRRDYVFKKLDGLGLEAYCKKNSKMILSAIYSIIKHWYKLGKPTKPVPVRNSFDGWWAIMEYICTEMLELSSPSANLSTVQQRLGSKVLRFLRDYGNYLKQNNMLPCKHYAFDHIVTICNSGGELTCGWTDTRFALDGASDNDDAVMRAAKSLGSNMTSIWRNTDSVELGDIRITRTLSRQTGDGPKKAYVYELIGGAKFIDKSPELTENFGEILGVKMTAEL